MPRNPEDKYPNSEGEEETIKFDKAFLKEQHTDFFIEHTEAKLGQGGKFYPLYKECRGLYEQAGRSEEPQRVMNEASANLTLLREQLKEKIEEIKNRREIVENIDKRHPGMEGNLKKKITQMEALLRQADTLDGKISALIWAYGEQRVGDRVIMASRHKILNVLSIQGDCFRVEVRRLYLPPKAPRSSSVTQKTINLNDLRRSIDDISFVIRKDGHRV
jgi:TolA-binding protein